MEKINIVEEMYKILKYVDKEYTIIPNLLEETFKELIKQRVDRKRMENENVQPRLILEEDANNNLYLIYYDANGRNLQILDEDKEYVGLDEGIRVKNSTFLYEFERTMKRKEIELAKIVKKRQDELFKKVEAGEITLNEYANYSAVLAKELLSAKTPEEYLERVLNNYREKLGDVTCRINCNIAKDEGVEKGPRKNKAPIRKAKEINIEKRIEGIKKLIPNYEEIVINNGDFYAYIYERTQNEENGFMIIVEPKEEKGNATKVIYLPEKRLRELRDDTHNKNASDIELKAEYLKRILEDPSKMNEIQRIKHGDYGKWLAIINYYLKGEKAIDPELLDIISDENFKKRFPREYLKVRREGLLREG